MERGVTLRPRQEDAAAYARFRAELNEQFRAALMIYFGKRVRNRAEAEDLTQEVFARLLALPEAPDATRVRPYVFAVAGNLLRDRARRARSHRADAHVSLDATDPLGLAEEREPERVLIGKESLDAAIAALGELGETTRNIFVLFRLERMRQREIASLLGLSVSTVEKHVIKAMAHLGAKFPTGSQ